MSTLILKHANKNRLGAIDWGPNDFDVLNATDASVASFCRRRRRKGVRGSGQSLRATIRASIHSRGYSATREQAMADFKAQWLSC